VQRCAVAEPWEALTWLRMAECCVGASLTNTPLPHAGDPSPAGGYPGSLQACLAASAGAVRFVRNWRDRRDGCMRGKRVCILYMTKGVKVVAPSGKKVCSLPLHVLMDSPVHTESMRNSTRMSQAELTATNFCHDVASDVRTWNVNIQHCIGLRLCGIEETDTSAYRVKRESLKVGNKIKRWCSLLWLGV